MSSGRTHAAVARFMLIPLGLISFTAFVMGDNEASLGIALGAISGLITTPDADIDGISFEEMRWFRFNSVAGHMFHLFWYPYGKVMKHRGFSHILFLGTASRIFYVMFLLSIFEAAFYYLIGVDLLVRDMFFVQLIKNHEAFAIFFFLSMSVQDFVHIIFDIVSTWLKRRKLLWYAEVKNL